MDPGLVATSLTKRTRELLARFDNSDRNSYSFNDSGDGTQYAEWFADLLDEWLKASVIELDI
jgi:hypothetical protein